MTYGAGSTGCESAQRIERIIDMWDGDSSAVWQSLWNNRSAIAVETAYPIGYGYPNTADGWRRYIYRLNNSTAVSSSQGYIPSRVYRDFASDIANLQPDGSSEADQGRRIYALLTGSRGAEYSQPGSPYREILCAWGAVLSSAIGSS